MYEKFLPEPGKKEPAGLSDNLPVQSFFLVNKFGNIWFYLFFFLTRRLRSSEIHYGSKKLRTAEN